MTRKLIGFVLDSFLLFLVALFIYRYRRLLKKNRVTISGSGLTWPDELHLKTIACLEEYKGTFTPTPNLGLVPTNLPCDTGGVESTEIESLGGGAFRKGNEMWQDETLSGVGITISGSGRHVPGFDDSPWFREQVAEMLKIFERGDRREEEDSYYDERK